MSVHDYNSKIVLALFTESTNITISNSYFKQKMVDFQKPVVKE